MTSFAEFSVRRPLGVILVIAAISVFGFFAIGRLPLLFLPEIESPNLSVTAPFPNSSPEEVERRVATPLEGAIGGMSGIESVSSTSSASSARVRAQFAVGTDMDLAAAEIRDRIRGLQVVIVTTARTDREGLRLLELLGMPFTRGRDAARAF